MPAGMETLGKVALIIEWETRGQKKVYRDLSKFRRAEKMGRQTKKQGYAANSLLNHQVAQTNSILRGNKKITSQLAKQNKIAKSTGKINTKKISSSLSTMATGGLASGVVGGAIGGAFTAVARLGTVGIVATAAAMTAAVGLWIAGGKKFKERVMEAKTAVSEGIEIHSSHVEQLSKKEVVFAPKGERGVGRQAEEWDIKNKLMQADVTRMTTELLGSQKGRGSNMGMVDLTKTMADVGLKLKGFGFEGSGLVNLTYTLIKASTALGSIHDKPTETFAEAILKLLSGEGEKFKLLTGMPLSKELQLQLINSDQKLHGILGKSLGYKVDSYTGIKREDRATAVLITRLYALTNKVLGADSVVGGDLARTWDSNANLSRLMTSYQKDLKNEFGRIAEPHTKKSNLDLIEALKKKIAVLQGETPEGTIGKAIGGSIDAKKDEELAKLKFLGEKVTKVHELEAAGDRIGTAAANKLDSILIHGAGSAVAPASQFLSYLKDSITGFFKSDAEQKKKDGDSHDRNSKKNGAPFK